MSKGKKQSRAGFSRQRADLEVGYLRDRALIFLDVAQRLFKEEKYDVAAFHIEQFCQLHLKYRIGLKLGEFLKTHSLTDLLLEFGGAYGARDQAESFIEQHRAVILDLEQAYIGTRYIPLEYTREQVELMLRFANVLTEFAEGRK
ncbi:MAG: HEPN domain-containing protein [Nitrospirae bacterium]|nr:HEPN domain-containing protein [Nitrospirota bacterium]